MSFPVIVLVGWAAVALLVFVERQVNRRYP